MSKIIGPNLVTSGLVLHLDAANPKSYQSGSTSWFDMSGNNNNGTLVSGSGYSSANFGSIVFNGTNSHISNFPVQISDTGSKTITAFVKPNSTARMGVCGTRTSVGANGFVFTINRTTPGNLTYFHAGYSIAEIPGNIQAGSWYQVAVSYDKSLAEVKLYVNGSQIGSTATSFLPMAVSSFNGNIGAEESGSVVMSGSIASVQIYNRALSPSEVLQNYNATRGRFGI